METAKKQGQRFRKAREAARLSRREVAERLGYSAWTVQSWELGRLAIRPGAMAWMEAQR